MSTDKQNVKIDSYERKTVFTHLKPHCYFAGEHDFMEVCEWRNGEGFDVEVSGKLGQRFQLTFGEFKALKKLIKKLEE
jgi:hypothetical protein